MAPRLPDLRLGGHIPLHVGASSHDQVVESLLTQFLDRDRLGPKSTSGVLVVPTLRGCIHSGVDVEPPHLHLL